MKKLLLAVALGAGVSSPAYAQPVGDPDDLPRAGDITTKDGFRAEARVNWERINDPQEDEGINYELGSGVGFGGEVGFDVAVSRTVVVGPYANYEVSSVESCDGDFCVKSGGFWSAGLQVGVLTGENGMLYGKLGYGEQTIDVVGPLEIEGQIINFDESESGGGYNFGFGYDQSFGQNFYGRLELTVSETKDIYTFDFQRTTAGVAIGARF